MQYIIKAMMVSFSNGIIGGICRNVFENHVWDDDWSGTDDSWNGILFCRYWCVDWLLCTTKKICDGKGYFDYNSCSLFDVGGMDGMEFLCSSIKW